MQRLIDEEVIDTLKGICINYSSVNQGYFKNRDYAMLGISFDNYKTLLDKLPLDKTSIEGQKVDELLKVIGRLKSALEKKDELVINIERLCFETELSEFLGMYKKPID